MYRHYNQFQNPMAYSWNSIPFGNSTPYIRNISGSEYYCPVNMYPAYLQYNCPIACPPVNYRQLHSQSMVGPSQMPTIAQENRRTENNTPVHVHLSGDTLYGQEQRQDDVALDLTTHTLNMSAGRNNPVRKDAAMERSTCTKSENNQLPTTTILITS